MTLVEHVHGHDAISSGFVVDSSELSGVGRSEESDEDNAAGAAVDLDEDEVEDIVIDVGVDETAGVVANLDGVEEMAIVQNDIDADWELSEDSDNDGIYSADMERY